MIKEANVTVIVGDMKKAIRFYVDALGLKLKAQYGDEFAQVEAPGTIIALHPATNNGPTPGDSKSLSIGFSVDNLEKTVADLKSKGVVFSRISEDGPVTLAFFSDVDGNPLYLSQSKWG